MTSALSAFGTLLKIGDGGSPETFTTIAEVKALNPPKLHLDTEEVTSHGSTAGWKEKVATLLEAGPVKFTVNFIPADATHSYATGLIHDMVTRTKRNFKVVFPDAGSTTWTFAAFVSDVDISADADGVLEADIELDLTGQPTLA